jgi:hypothetical protein
MIDDAIRNYENITMFVHLIYLSYFYYAASSQSLTGYVLIEYMTGCGNGDDICALHGPKNIVICNANVESCYDLSFELMARNGNDTKYWISWWFEGGNYHYQREKNYPNKISLPQKILNPNVLMNIYTDCLEGYNCTLVPNNKPNFCNDTVSCYNLALRYMMDNGNNTNNWIRLTFH